jgi:ABC-type antimicrobial peptide transport system permease subunit
VSAALENLRLAFGALRANWFRAVLTALGIVIGVGSLVAVTAVSAGAQRQVAESIRRLGSNVVLVDGEFITIGTGQTATDRTITPQDVAAISKLPTVTEVAPDQDMESLTMSAGRHTTITHLFGVTPSFADVYNQTASRGRLISQVDISFGRSVIVLGTVPAGRLFPGRDPIGGTVRIGSHEFDVVGVQARRGTLGGGENLDNRAFVPLPLVLGVLMGGTTTKSVSVRVRSESEIGTTMEAIATLLRKQHNLPPSYADDFSLEDQAAFVKESQQATTTFRVLTFALGGIALLVGGIGIMNMMLVSVHERTREIGIRKSVGADPRRVQLQFLIEAVVLTTLAGAAGIIAGIAATRVIGSLIGWPTAISWGSLLLGFTVAVAVGLFFGYYPARRAARLDPIAALRYE